MTNHDTQITPPDPMVVHNYFVDLYRSYRPIIDTNMERD